MSDPKADDTIAFAEPVAALSAEPGAEPFDEPIDDDLDERLAAAAPRRLANRATYALLALVIAVAGFVGGAQVQKQYGTPAAASTGSPAGANAAGGQYPGAGQFPGGGAARASGAPGGGTGQQGGGRAGAITGTVKLVDGNTVYIETPDGQTITVKTSDQTTVLAPGKLSDLTAGATVSVQGQTTDGTVTATTVTRTK
ncbi:hypothetical protein [Virgisporangium aurantiacum]|uniref:DUF5666 domain-containing protein n=1 Tax=Virgisporangium aurantiacum TaxID=175570 RepID=A0A8J3Z1E1_9ACTN|nr:hypothetical protein [Virgisporangium aurantiacum]GIJ53318.1 hypothetical protein Vau01_008340 [Virgisporangium aurantiacum]